MVNSQRNLNAPPPDMAETRIPVPDIETQRLLLRRFQANDLPDVYRALSHPDVVRHYGVQFDSLEATQAQMDWFSMHEASGTGIWWAVCNRATGQLLGGGGLSGLTQNHRKAELGFWLLPEHWGRGYLREAVPAILDHAFTTLGLHRIEGFVETQNAPCKRALDRLGFQHEGTMRDCEWKDNAFISIDIYATFPPQS